MPRLGERKATEKDEAYMIKRHAEGASCYIIADEMTASPELTSLSHMTVYRYVVPGAWEKHTATKKKYRSTEEGALVDIWRHMRQSEYEVEMTFEQFVNAWEEQKKERGYACPLGGGTIHFKVTTHKEIFHSNRISPDRIDTTKEYTLANLWFVTTKQNLKKSGCTLDIMELTLKEKKKRET
tara:strand:- start:56 stop:601 length:546 start_codon:yes stop_codon:yes gene_type:complete